MPRNYLGWKEINNDIELLFYCSWGSDMYSQDYDYVMQLYEANLLNNMFFFEVENNRKPDWFEQFFFVLLFLDKQSGCIITFIVAVIFMSELMRHFLLLIVAFAFVSTLIFLECESKRLIEIV